MRMLFFTPETNETTSFSEFKTDRTNDRNDETPNLPTREVAHLSFDDGRLEDVPLFTREPVFDCTLGYWNADTLRAEQKPDVTLSYAHSNTVSKIHDAALRLEVETLLRLGVLAPVNYPELGATTFKLPKKDGTMRVITVFHHLNERLCSQKALNDHIFNPLLKLESLLYATPMFSPPNSCLGLRTSPRVYVLSSSIVARLGSHEMLPVDSCTRTIDILRFLKLLPTNLHTRGDNYLKNPELRRDGLRSAALSSTTTALSLRKEVGSTA